MVRSLIIGILILTFVYSCRKDLVPIEGMDLTVQVNPREINLFYIKDGLRERIVENDGVFSVLNSDFRWNKTELLKHLETQPEYFSPNVIMRPLYQEVILPNLCYIGGGGEMIYWLQLKSNFEIQNVTFPILLLPRYNTVNA